MRVPDYEQQVQPSAVTVNPPNAPTAVPAAFGTDVARANAQTADVLGNISAHLFKMAQEASEKQILDRETEFRKEMQSVLFDPSQQTVTVGDKEFTRPKGVLNRELAQASGAIEDYDQTYYTQIRDKYMKDLSPHQQGKLSTAMDKYYVSYRDNVIQHEANQGRLDYRNSWEKNINIKAADTFQTSDPLALQMKVDGINLEIDDAQQKGIISYAAAEKMKKDFDTQLFYARVNIDPQGTVNELGKTKDSEGKGGGLFNNLDPEERSKLASEANMMIEKQKAVNEELAKMAINKNETDLVDLKIKGQATPEMVKRMRDNKQIGAKFADTMITALLSKKTIKAETTDKDFIAMSNAIINTNAKDAKGKTINSPEGIRLDLLTMNSTGELSDADYNLLNTFNNIVTDPNVDKAMPAKNGWQTISWWSDEYAGMRPEVRANIFKSYMQKVAGQMKPDQAATEAMMEQILKLHPQAKAYPKGGKVVIDINGTMKKVTPDLQITDAQMQSPERQYMKSQEEKE
jgi:hypothetical protein